MRAHPTTMEFREDCQNFEPTAGHVSLHAGADGVRSGTMGRCRLALTDMGGCPADCSRYRA